MNIGLVVCVFIEDEFAGSSDHAQVERASFGKKGVDVVCVCVLLGE